VDFSASDDFGRAGWRHWLLHAPAARRCGTAIVIAAGLGAATAFVVAVTALVRDRPTPGLTVLVLPAVPVIFVGQLWMIAWMNLRQGPRSGSWRERRRVLKTRSGWTDPRTFFFGPLQTRHANFLLAIAFSGWLLGMTAFPAIANGGPAGAGAGCRYRLESHGSYTCVSERTYQHAGAGEQRFAASIMLAFFAVHTGAALGGRRMQAWPAA